MLIKGEEAILKEFERRERKWERDERLKIPREEDEERLKKEKKDKKSKKKKQPKQKKEESPKSEDNDEALWMAEEVKRIEKDIEDTDAMLASLEEPVEDLEG